MYLSKLELHGFKSFAERTVVHFAPGITVVVGPNGCGKSNVVDAVRWVIGEQRARILRSDKMDNVIFNGTVKRRPVGMAEVLLTIENTRGVLPTEYEEVTLGRRLYRSGESEYLLNGVQCRLKDITDLFMDTGMGAGAYSVIELKMIEEILSENAHDRRRLLEEAAGITKYKLRRSQTLRKLDSTQVDLTRLRDLTDELEKRVRTLKRQANRAKHFKTHQERLHHLELALAQVEFERLFAQEQTLRAEIQALQDRVEAQTVQLAQAEAGLEALRTRHIEQEQALAASQGRLNTHLEAVRTLEADHRLESERLEATRRDLDRIQREQAEAEVQREGLKHTLEQLRADLDDATPILDDARQTLDNARTSRDLALAAADAQRQLLQDLRRREQQAADTLGERRRSLDRLTNRLDLLEQERGRVEAQTLARAAEAEVLAARVEEARTSLDTAQATREDARSALEAVERRHAEGQQALDDALATQREVERRHDAAATEVHLLDSLLSSYEEFSASVQYLAATPGWSKHPLRTVADVLACDDEDRIALDTALGAFASCIVVKTVTEARAAIGRLRDQEKGRATFLVLDRLPALPPPAAVVPAGASATLLRSHVRVAEPAYALLADVLLQHCYLVTNLEDVSASAVPSARVLYVTRTGEWLDARGFLHSGSAQAGASPAGGRLGRREQRDAAHEALQDLEDRLAAAGGAVETAQAALQNLSPMVSRADLAAAEKAVVEAVQAHDRLSYEAAAVARRDTEHRERLATLQGDLAAGHAGLETARAAVAHGAEILEARRLERADAEATFQTAEADGRAALQRYNEANVAAVQARNRYDNLQRDLERTTENRAELGRRNQERRIGVTRLQAHQVSLQDKRDALAVELAAVQGNRGGLEAGVTVAKTTLMETKVAISEVEAQLREMRRGREQEMREESQRAVRLAEVRTHAQDLVANIQEDFNVSLLDMPVTLDDDFEEGQARREVQRLRGKIRGMGPVNELALEAYEEEQARLDFLQTQLADLESAEATLVQTIDEINTTASMRFNQTFASIRANFMRLFQELFGDEATADLILEDPNDPLESLIEIMAKPRGKRPITLAQLSGGEKTLTAIALLFAIYLVKPSPFCILDEVDAPLDDANVGRYMHLIRTFADSTQFILVTHNKRTMEAADRMYGITMQEQGVSQLVGVTFDETVEG